MPYTAIVLTILIVLVLGGALDAWANRERHRRIAEDRKANPNLGW